MAGFDDGDKLAGKRAEVLGTAKKTKNFAVMFLTLALTLVGAYLFLGEDAPLPAGASSSGSATGGSPAGTITHNLSEFNDGAAHYYEYTGPGGIGMKYFLVQAGDGSLHSALDACESCWPAGKGYRQDGDEMVCQNCRMRFKIVKVGQVKGGCNPVPLPHVISGGKVTIKTSDLDTGVKYFDLKK